MKDYSTQADCKKQNIPENMRYFYIGSLVDIDGKKYPVSAAIPLGTQKCQLPTAEEIIIKIINNS